MQYETTMERCLQPAQDWRLKYIAVVTSLPYTQELSMESSLMLSFAAQTITATGNARIHWEQAFLSHRMGTGKLSVILFGYIGSSGLHIDVLAP